MKIRQSLFSKLSKLVVFVSKNDGIWIGIFIPLQYISETPTPIPRVIAPAAVAPGPVPIPVNTCPTDSPFRSLCLLASSNIGTILGNILEIIFVIAILLALFLFIFAGIKLLISQGEKEGVEKARSTIISVVIGLVVIFLSYFAVNFILQLFVPGTNITNLVLPPIV